jgi:ABC-type glycerol-3-phosphate transport system substrate-binding protein
MKSWMQVGVGRGATPWIGGVLLAGILVLATSRVWMRERHEADSGTVTIRFAHVHLEGRVREAFDEVARRYMARRPGVRVEQIAIPQRIYASWSLTQLVGGTAPDILHLAGGIDRERLARYFVPLTEMVDPPNPYNAGTPLAELPWRETFFDGLAAPPAFQPRLQEIYGVPNSLFTFRLYYNVDLYRQILGTRPTPATYEDLVETLAEVRAWTAEQTSPVVPIIGARFGPPFMVDPLFDNLFTSQTQRLTRELNVSRHLLSDFREQSLAFLRGQWDLRSPAIRSGLDVMAEVGRYVAPGFVQLRREDSLLQFAQGRALFLVSGSWDVDSIRLQAPFELGVMALPVPDARRERFAPFSFGPISEASTFGAAALGLTRGSRHPDVALDFLRFLTSEEENRTLTKRANWLPAIVGVEPRPEMEPFMPAQGGYVKGMDLHYGPDTQRVWDRHLHLLFAHGRTVDDFVAALEPEYGDALRADLRRTVTSGWRNVDELESASGAWWVLAESGDLEAAKRFSAMMETQNAVEMLNLWTEAELRALAQEKGTR